MKKFIAALWPAAVVAAACQATTLLPATLNPKIPDHAGVIYTAELS